MLVYGLRCTVIKCTHSLADAVQEFTSDGRLIGGDVSSDCRASQPQRVPHNIIP